MKTDMYRWVADTIAAKTKKAVPVLSFPSVSLLHCTVSELTHSSELQAKGMLEVAKRVDSGASVSFMDLSVEAEAFGATIANSEIEVPTVVGTLLAEPEAVETLDVPAVGTGRTSLYIEAIARVSKEITDRPVFAGCIGPFSLAGRLMGMTEIMINCYEEEDAVHALLEKCASFVEQYALAFKNAGANGVVIAEPAAGLLSPKLMDEFSCQYMKKIIEAVQDAQFIVIYHNCGASAQAARKEISAIGAKAFHFGNAMDMPVMVEAMPSDALVMGNVDPAGQLRNGTPASVREATLDVMRKCCAYPNFVISTGCDVPPASPWENIDAFFSAVEDFYKA